MNYIVFFGSDIICGTNGVLNVQIDNKIVNFFRIREIYRISSEGSHLAVDCDIKDGNNIREVKLFKSKPVVQNENIQVFLNQKTTIVTRDNGIEIIKIEQIELDNSSILDFEPFKKVLSGHPSSSVALIKQTMNEIKINAVIKITGDFYAGEYHLEIGDDYSLINGLKIGGNIKFKNCGITLTKNGFSI